MATELKVTLVPGDGIGPEVTHEAVLILEAISQWSGSVFHFIEKPIGGAAIRAAGIALTSGNAGSSARQRCGPVRRGGWKRIQFASAG